VKHDPKKVGVALDLLSDVEDHPVAVGQVTGIAIRDEGVVLQIAEGQERADREQQHRGCGKEPLPDVLALLGSHG
jgi:hypothetical protein